MALPRLTPSANDFILDGVVVNKKLRPYFEVWFQNEKKAGETPQEFALRILKIGAQNFHIQANIKVEQDAIEQAKINKSAEVQADIEAFGIEAD